MIGTEAPGLRRKADFAGAGCAPLREPVLENRFDHETDRLLGPKGTLATGVAGALAYRWGLSKR